MQALGVVFLVLIVLACIIFGPYLTLWCIYTIWNVEVATYDFTHWLAALLLGGFIGGLLRGAVKSNK